MLKFRPGTWVFRQKFTLGPDRGVWVQRSTDRQFSDSHEPSLAIPRLDEQERSHGACSVPSKRTYLACKFIIFTMCLMFLFTIVEKPE